jgi:GTP pyrophosphokinase
MRLSVMVVAAGLLHDVVEDTGVTIEEIQGQFGDEIAHIVEAVTKLKRVKYYGGDLYAENMRRMFLAMSKDVRVVFVKFADRLHNLRTLYARPKAKQLRVAKESLEIYAPIARRLGMGELRGEIEDLAFLYAHPKDFHATRALLEEGVHEREKLVNQTIEELGVVLEQAEVAPVSLHGRVKRLYSLFNKLKRYDGDIERIYDLIAVRVVVGDVSDCYHILGLIHSKWKPLPGRIKDYIAHPKPNGYQSLHTTVFSNPGTPIEFQIRTTEMHEEAEYGIAAHWRYKEQGRRLKERDRPWLRVLQDIQKCLEHGRDFLKEVEDIKLEIFRDRIFVFTPKGDVIDLPEGATPVDFAYAIHSEIGNTCAGARVNEKISNLDTELASGDLCEIIIDKQRKGPNSDWLKFAKTNHGRAKIRTALKKHQRRWLERVMRRRS